MSDTALLTMSSVLTRLLLLFCEYHYDFELKYPPLHSYLVSCLLSKAFECYWYSPSVFGREWERLSFPKKFYMDGIPFVDDPSPHLISFGFNLLMTLVIAQILVFCTLVEAKHRPNPIILGALLGLLIIAINGRDYAFSRRPLQLFYINQAHSMCQCVFISTILTYV